MHSARALSIGFTLIELLISVSIITILAGFLIPSFTRYLDTQNVKQAKEQVKNDLRTLQNRALSGVGAAEGVSYWGVKFDDNTRRYFYFTSSANDWPICSSTTSGETGEILPSDTMVRNGTLCVFFSFSDGGATYVKSFSPSNTVITLGYSNSSNDCEGVEVNAAGLIKGVSKLSCELN
ncbi:type II secretion system protein [candidate division WWE3 bacterium]|nr:type II secretion system protein [candidate division WWE3 bacterium]